MWRHTTTPDGDAPRAGTGWIATTRTPVTRDLAAMAHARNDLELRGYEAPDPNDIVSLEEVAAARDREFGEARWRKAYAVSQRSSAIWRSGRCISAEDLAGLALEEAGHLAGRPVITDHDSFLRVWLANGNHGESPDEIRYDKTAFLFYWVISYAGDWPHLGAVLNLLWRKPLWTVQFTWGWEPSAIEVFDENDLRVGVAFSPLFVTTMVAELFVLVRRAPCVPCNLLISDKYREEDTASYTIRVRGTRKQC